MVSFLSLYESGKRNRFRYQPTPVGRYAPQKLDGSFSSKGPSMLQSCGRSRALQSASENSGISAPGTSPLRNFQPRSKFSRILCSGLSPGPPAKAELMVGSTETNAAVPATALSSSRRVREPLGRLDFFIIGLSSAASGATNFRELQYGRMTLVHSDNLPLLRLRASRLRFLNHESGERTGSSACVCRHAAQTIN